MTRMTRALTTGCQTTPGNQVPGLAIIQGAAPITRSAEAGISSSDAQIAVASPIRHTRRVSRSAGARVRNTIRSKSSRPANISSPMYCNTVKIETENSIEGGVTAVVSGGGDGDVGTSVPI